MKTSIRNTIRNIIIFFVCSIIAYAIATSNIISDDWKLLIMFFGGVVAGTIVAAFDKVAYDQKIENLNKEIDILKQIRKNIKYDD